MTIPRLFLVLDLFLILHMQPYLPFGEGDSLKYEFSLFYPEIKQITLLILPSTQPLLPPSGQEAVVSVRFPSTCRGVTPLTSLLRSEVADSGEGGA